MPATGFLSRLSRRLTDPLHDLDAEELAGSVRDTGSDCVAESCRGRVVTITGRIRTVQTGGGDDCLGVIAEVFDGTDSLDVCWLGRRSIPGIDTGRHLRVVGRIGERDGHKIMFNPRYDLLECRPGELPADAIDE